MNVAQADIPKPKKKINKVFWALTIIRVAVLITCMRHVADAFLSLEKEGTHALWGWLPAIAIDGGLLFMAWKLGKDPHNRKLQIGFGYFIFVEAVAQIDGSARALKFAFVEDWRWLGLKMFLFSFSLPFLLAALVEVKTDEEEEDSTEPSTALTTTVSTNHQPAPSAVPDVSVDKPSTPSTPRQPKRITGVNRKALPYQPNSTIPMLKASTDRQNPQPIASTTPSTDRKNEIEPSTSNHQVKKVTMVDVEDEDLQKSIDTVRLFRLNNNLSETARQTGLTVEGVRVRIKALWKNPQQRVWVETQIPDWIEKNRHKFLASD